MKKRKYILLAKVEAKSKHEAERIGDGILAIDEKKIGGVLTPLKEGERK